MRSMLMWLLACSGIYNAVTTAPSATAGTTCHSAEIYLADDESPLFELAADLTIASTGAAVTGSTPVAGVFWSERLQQATSEDARQFHLCVTDGTGLHAAAEAVRHRFDQQAVLTFDYQSVPDAFTVTVPDVDFARFHAAFLADPAARIRLEGGSVTADRTLILVVGGDDLDLARRLAQAAGGDWTQATLESGDRELVVG